MLLAVDLGLRFGMALYDREGRLVRYSSHHVNTRAKLKRAAYGLIQPIEGLEAVVLEGDRALGEIWARLAEKRDAEVIRCGAEAWREVLMMPRQRRSGVDAKEQAGVLARAVIDWSGAPAPTTRTGALRHDTAEAILIGLWGALELGWLEELPRELGGPVSASRSGS